MLAASHIVPSIFEVDERSRRDEKGSKAVAATSKADESEEWLEVDGISEELKVDQKY